jgi:hypothetical protein
MKDFTTKVAPAMDLNVLWLGIKRCFVVGECRPSLPWRHGPPLISTII